MKLQKGKPENSQRKYTKRNWKTHRKKRTKGKTTVSRKPKGPT